MKHDGVKQTMRSFRVGDDVRAIPHSYSILSKAFLNDESAWHTADAQHDSRVMLGGAYSILSVRNTTAGSIYKVLPHAIESDSLDDHTAALSKDVRKCPFQIGDRLLFRPQWSSQDFEFLKPLITLHYAFDSKDRTHAVTFVLNDYYVFVDYDKCHSLAFPFRWCDFELPTQ